MATRETAPIVVRARHAWVAAAVVGTLLTATGCHKGRRSVLRPILPAPRALSAPAPGCSNCGSGGATVVTEPGTAVIRDGGPAGLSGEPVITQPGGAVDSSVPRLDSPMSLDPASSTRRAPSSEVPPKATIDEPGLDLAPAASTSRSRSLRPPVESRPKAAPELSAPAPTSMTPSGGDRLRTASASGVVRRASASQDDLQAYFAPEASDDLFFPNKADRPWKYIVVHHSNTETGSYDQIDGEHRKLLGFDGCGYHFVIGNGTGSGDGQIEVAQRWVNQKHGVHCRNARRADIDEYGIGVCLIGDFEKAPPTPRQMAALKALTAHLSERYRIEQDRVETHAHVAATETVCPGKHFPTDGTEIPAVPRSESQADATPPTSPTAPRRHVPTAWRLREVAPTPAAEAPIR